MNVRKNEIRRFLVGAFLEGPDGIEACTGLFNPFLAGSRRGALLAYVFGVTTVKRVIAYRGKEEKIFAAFADAFADVGRRANLTTAPEALCAVVLPLIRSPYVFTFETDDEGEGFLIYYSARGFLSRIKGKIRSKKLLRSIDETLLISADEKKQLKQKKDKTPPKKTPKKEEAEEPIEEPVEEPTEEPAEAEETAEETGET